MRFICLITVFSFLISCSSSTPANSSHEARKIEILFLGHEQENHDANKYMPVLASALATSGINVTYTNKASALNDSTLSLYDGLIIYANHDEISPQQEKALLDFVDQGNAFIPIHSASFCFRNSEEYIKLVGAQFSTHGRGTFTGEIVNHEHSLSKSLTEFSTWDETYVHTKFADDITVLMERVDGEHREPYTWVKSHGKGKVFYTAYGHDERTWYNPEFQELIKQGILWAVEPTVKKQWQEYVKTIPTLKYDGVANVPNYEKRDPAPQYQLPLTPEESQKLIQVPAGFELQLFAAEPDIINPIAMNWDEKGRLWVIETVDYPNTIHSENGLGDDRIKILEDTDHDGKADKVTVFAENLNIPTSFTFANGGIIVAQAPSFLFLKDTDGDDKADVREELFNGWGVFDTHAGPSNLQQGIDNKIYGAVGYSGFEGEILNKEHKFGQGVYRFNTDLSDFEHIAKTSNNTWGLGINEDNAIFASTANNTHSVFVGIPSTYFTDVKGLPEKGSAKIDGHYDIKPITQKIRQVDVFGGFTAASGHHFYTAKSYPESFWNKVAFVTEPTGNLVHMAVIEKDGAGYLEKDGGNLFASADEWVSPVEAKVGPDGQVWILDWYNFIIQHNPTPSESRGGYDAERGEGAAYINPLRDKSRGRIWRVVDKKNSKIDFEKVKQTLGSFSTNELVNALTNDNLFWRLTAQRLLVENKSLKALPQLYKLIESSSADVAVLHALWTIKGLGVVNTDPMAKKLVLNALNHESGIVRKAAIQILPKSTETDNAMMSGGLLTDKDPVVQLEALLYFSHRPASESLGQTLYKLSENSAITNDTWLANALYIASAKHKDGFIKSYLINNPTAEIPAEEVELEEVKELDLVPVAREVKSLDDSHWSTMDLPQYSESAGLDMDGVIWYRKNFTISEGIGDGSGKISLGPIDDSDVTYINGTKVGGLISRFEKDRVYDIAKGLLNKGENTIAVRVQDDAQGGGMYGTAKQMFIELSQGQQIPLSGPWKYDIAEVFESKNDDIDVFEGASFASVIFNSYASVDNGMARTSLEEADSTIIEISVVKGAMKFDVTDFEVQAGQSIEIVFSNPDYMQHNIVITKPGQKDKVGQAADKLATSANGAELHYVPNIPEVLFATEILDPNSKTTLKFTVPTEPGDYPFICTFPGHWQIMQGVMKVVAVEN
ncbi:ThuA domain-containing protein [Paraglaciecola aquimarina]|uniref:ThuA domain-containing protein n=1 Tax=Paraglaciecola algarum TaxID=3050085 RepID=A0ABS9D3Q4_9ALTE|nr:PVC-type heme-binding CxxCH protein [Paraglaciecola sp. G1-23]MCF2946657.1 ThuA domain-containing protein [Paraglaciecola sp. G1-23]